MTELQAIFKCDSDGELKDEYLEAQPMVGVRIHRIRNAVEFQLQQGAIKDAGVNGCQIDAVLAFAEMFIHFHNQKYPCRENSLVITKIQEARHWLEARTKDRDARGVEGTDAA